MDLLPADARVRLHKLLARIYVPGLEELIRLIESDKFDDLSERQIGEIGEYHSIEIGGEAFFDRAFSTSKEAAVILRLAKGPLGREAILADLRDLREALEEMV